VRTDDWKYIHYPNGEGQADTEKAELYDIKADPKEQHNLIEEASAQGKLAELRNELDRIMTDDGRCARQDAGQSEVELRDAGGGDQIGSDRGQTMV
jgi:arylsulfatase A-like enzyme